MDSFEWRDVVRNGKARKQELCKKCGEPGHRAKTCGRANPERSLSARALRCGNCGEIGHNKKTCASPTNREHVPKRYQTKGTTRCSRCGENGHNVVKCTQTEVTRADRFCTGCGEERLWSHSGDKGSVCIKCSKKAKALKPRPCAGCGNDFTPSRGDGKVCSDACRSARLSALHTGTHEQLTGLTFGWWTVLAHKRADECVCRCRCGYESIVDSSALRAQTSRSCRGCVAARRLEAMTPAEIEAMKARRVAKQRESYRLHYEQNKEAIQAKRSERKSDPDRAREYSARALEKLRGTRAINRSLVNKLKAEPCMDCGKTFPPVCMDFDHRPGEIKIDDVSKLSKNGRSSDVILAEIAKCDLVCSNCHRVRGFNRLHDAP